MSSADREPDADAMLPDSAELETLPPRRRPALSPFTLLLLASAAVSQIACDMGASGGSDGAAPGATLGGASPSSGAAVPAREAGAPSGTAGVALLDGAAAVPTPGFTGERLSDGTVRLSWQPDPGAAGYNVYRQGRYHTTVHVPRYTDEKAVDGDGAASYEIHAFTGGEPKTFRKIAGGLTVEPHRLASLVSSGTPGFTATIDGDDVRLSWRRQADAAGYNVYRQGRYLTTVHTESHTDAALAAGTYRYEIHAFTAGASKTFRKIASGLTVALPAGGGGPSAESALAADGAKVDGPQRDFSSSRTAGFTARLLDDSSVRLSWRADSGAAGYNVYRQGRYLTTVHGEHYTDRGVSRGDYRYEIHAFTGGSRNTFRRIATGLTVEVRPIAASEPDAAPQRFSSSSTPGFEAERQASGAVRLSWRRDPNAEGYNVYREGRYHTTVHTESYTDTTASAGDYRYEIHAFTGGTPKRFTKIADGLTVTASGGEGVKAKSSPDSQAGSQAGSQTGSRVKAAKVLAPEKAPAAAEPDVRTRKFVSATTAGFTGQLLDNGDVRIRWNSDPDAEGYNVYRNARYYKTVRSTGFTDTGLFDRDYYYEIQSFTPGENKRFRHVATGLTVKVRGLGRLDPNAPRPDPNRLDGYDLVFADEFDTGTLDTSKWNTSYLWGPELTINSEKQYYVDTRRDPDFGFDPFTFENGNLVINSIPTPAALREKANNKPYLSGVITSYDAFKFTYGYAEMRARMPYGKGYWTAFWLLNAYYGDEDPEIDIVEFIGHDQDVAYHTYHYYDRHGNLRSTKSEPTPGIDFTADFHTFGVDWRPGSLVFYIDGVEVHRISDPEVSDQDMYLIANTALGGWWPGSPNASTPFPGRYEIDYIRVYRQRAPYERAPFSDQPSGVAPAPDVPRASPGHRPSFDLWPEGYPARRSALSRHEESGRDGTGGAADGTVP